MRTVIETTTDAGVVIRCRDLDVEVQAVTLPEAARAVQAMANDAANGLEAAKATGWLMAPGHRRLANLRQLLDVVGPLASPPTAPTK